MYKIRVVVPRNWRQTGVVDEVLEALVNLVPEDIRGEIYNQGYGAGYDDGKRDGIEAGYEEGKQFVTFDRDPLKP